jgi:hypothetical protein
MPLSTFQMIHPIPQTTHSPPPLSLSLGRNARARKKRANEVGEKGKSGAVYPIVNKPLPFFFLLFFTSVSFQPQRNNRSVTAVLSSRVSFT